MQGVAPSPIVVVRPSGSIEMPAGFALLPAVSYKSNMKQPRVWLKSKA